MCPGSSCSFKLGRIQPVSLTERSLSWDPEHLKMTYLKVSGMGSTHSSSVLQRMIVRGSLVTTLQRKDGAPFQLKFASDVKTDDTTHTHTKKVLQRLLLT